MLYREETIPFAPFETPSLVLLLQWFGCCDLACLRTPEHSVGDVSSWMFFVGIYRELYLVYMTLLFAAYFHLHSQPRSVTTRAVPIGLAVARFLHIAISARSWLGSVRGGSVFSVRFRLLGWVGGPTSGADASSGCWQVQRSQERRLVSGPTSGGVGKRRMLAWEQLGARWMVLRLLAPIGTSVLLGPFRCFAARTCELRANCAVCLCMHRAVYCARHVAT